MRPLLNTKIFLSVFFLFSSALFADDTAIELIRLQHRPGSEILPLVTPFLEASEQAIDNGNSLIIKATKNRLPAIKTLIGKLDIKLANLTITVIQSSTKTAHDLNAGAAVGVTIPKDHLGRSRGAMHGYLANTDRFKEGEQTQILRTLEGHPAHIKTGRLHPVDNISIFDSGYGYPSVSSNTQYIEATSGFMVVPRLSGQDEVILEISPWMDTMNWRGGIDTQSAHSNIRTKLGRWVEMGSINQKEQNQDQGFLRHSRSTRQKSLHILIKVDRAD
ncbi:hypothetical protein [Methylomarinum vadi]|uniref:hypothetical protein n=1 Tax=Methylomarinum vadi TaxID=438855 RepID=UPI0004DEE1AC|nr:hypothetical protein [Methylomarinum vadi]